MVNFSYCFICLKCLHYYNVGFTIDLNYAICLCKTRQDKTRQDKTRQDKTRQTNYGFLKFGFVKNFLKYFSLQVLTFILLFSFILPAPASAYTTNMNASIVVGSSNFTSLGSGTGPAIIGAAVRGIMVDPNGRLIVGDTTLNRILIWNQVPTANGASADLVIGQANFTSISANRGGSIAANTLSGPVGVFSDGNKLFVDDRVNNRILIWNTFPTTNGQAADVVVGNSNFTTKATATCNATTFSDPYGIWVAQGKLFIADRVFNRILIYNSIPTANGASADTVVGQQDLTTCSSLAISAQSFSDARYPVVDSNGRLFVADNARKRVLIWNSIPTTNFVSADVVVGQADFTSSETGVTASRFGTIAGVYSNGNRLFISDSNARVLIFNTIPSANNASADIVLGQSSFTGSADNGGGSRSASGFKASLALNLFEYQNKLLAIDEGNQRVLIFDNIVKKPGLSLNNSPEGAPDNKTRLKGRATVDSPYTLQSVQYSINGGGWSNSTADDGSFNSTSEYFYFDFDPRSNQPRDLSGNLIEGYTVRVKSTNTNADVTDNLFYFQPFNLNEPLDNAITTSLYPSFDFSVIKQKNILKDNLSKYQIQVRAGGSDSTASWRTIIDDIPIDGTLDNTNTVVVDNDKLKAVYTDDSSRIKVYSKINSLSGSMQWKVVAIDKTGHTQDSGARSLRINSRTNITNNFPLAILNISGLGNSNISTNNISAIKDTYYLGSLNPIFYGIAFTNAKVTLTLTEQDCHASLAMTVDSCTKTYSTIANQDSRYGINIPKGDLKWSKKYTTNMSVAYNQDYNELPTFTLLTSAASSIQTTPSTTPQTTSQENDKVTTPSVTSPTPQPTPTTQPIGGQQETSKKNCFLFWCF